MEVFQGLNETLPNESSVQKMSNLVRKYLVLCLKKNKKNKNTQNELQLWWTSNHRV